MTTTEGGWLLDTNVLVALTLRQHTHHRAAHAALQGHAGRWATCPATESALYRLLLNPHVAGHPFGVGQVDQVVRGMRQDPRWVWAADDTTLSVPVVDTSVMVGHRQVMDLHLVNLAATSGLVLATFDASIPASLAPADRRHVLVLSA
jgi:toxin-antitoxin system PIN domain toxin